MKKVLAIMFVLASLPMMAADLELTVAAGSPGRVDDHTIDVASVNAGDAIVVELWLRNLDFTLAGFEGEFQFPTWLQLVDTNAVGTGTPPYETGLAATQQLPADANGDDTAATFRNDQGFARVGGVITDPNQRPTSGDQLLATFRMVLGRDFNPTNLASRTLASCISNTETLKFLACTTGASTCHIIADDSAAAHSVNYVANDLLITVNNTSTTVHKGDANKSGGLTTQDVGTAIQCIVFGDHNTNANCPLLSTDPDWAIRLDVNCSGAVTTQDIGPLIRRAVGLNNRPSSKKLDYKALASAGSVEIPGGNAANVVGVFMQAQGSVKFGQPELSKEGIEDGWQIVGQYLADVNAYNLILFNMAGENLPVPNVNLPYTANGNAKLAIADIESVTVNGQVDDRDLRMNRLDLRDPR